MIYFKIKYYDLNKIENTNNVKIKALGGQYLVESQLKNVKYLVRDYLDMYKKINIRIKPTYCPGPIKSKLHIQEIEVL